MQLNELQPNKKRKESRRIGRGGKKGTYSGKGVKGQRSRAGRKMQPFMREIIKRYHKLRGYRRELLIKEGIVLNVEKLDKAFENGQIVSFDTLLAKGMIKKIKGKKLPVKILAKGEITKKIIIEKLPISKLAKTKIEKAGGSVK